MFEKNFAKLFVYGKIFPKIVVFQKFFAELFTRQEQMHAAALKSGYWIVEEFNEFKILISSWVVNFWETIVIRICIILGALCTKSVDLLV